MKRKLHYLLLIFIGLNAGAQTISMIGSTSPSGSWAVDTDMITTDNITYTLNNVTLTLATDPNTTGLKFRLDHSWTTNWGSAAFPSGTGTQGGANIMTQAGTYNVTFNRLTGAYNFVGTTTVIPTVALVGPAVGGWPVDPQVDAIQLASTDGVTYSSNSVVMTADAFKFRQDNNWSVSWGGITFPTGPQAGNETNDIVATTAGNYRVNFNRTTGAYVFDFPGIAIVGEAVGGWPGEFGNPGPIDIHQMSTNDGETYTIYNLAVTDAIPNGGVKFRQDNSWTTSWGNSTFPSAGSSNGTNIPTVAGTYDITFTRSTGGYNFTPSLGTADFTKSTFNGYPNPSQHQWHITSSSEAMTGITLYDIMGKKIAAFTPNGSSTTIDNNYLLQGVYFARITTATISHTMKLIKE